MTDNITIAQFMILLRVLGQVLHGSPGMVVTTMTIEDQKFMGWFMYADKQRDDGVIGVSDETFRRIFKPFHPDTFIEYDGVTWDEE